ncbi:unnamed protein product [Caenorhabditis angaria]|uniref:Protein transport protein sec16 n=1 Tax=Caenorhabditis angaria TaxID=860376 RepID=A0A9P1MY37_9PELO|nr:unnamed protein product [Caenorhabditis angaria]
MRYDQNRMKNVSQIINDNNSDMSDWGVGTNGVANGNGNIGASSKNNGAIFSPPSSRYGGEDDASSTTHSRPRRSRLDNDIQPPMPILYPRPQQHSTRKLPKNNGVPRGIDPNMVNGRRSAGNHGSHNATFNGYDLNYSRSNYSLLGRSYAKDYSKRSGGGQILAPRRPRSTLGAGLNYESYSTSGEEPAEENLEEDGSEGESEGSEEEELRKYYLQAQRAQGSRSVNSASQAFFDGGEAYYFGVVHLDLELVAHVIKTCPPPNEYYELQAIEKVAYIFYCAVYKKPYHNIQEFHKVFNREFYKFVCAGDSNDLALFKICKSMQDQHRLKQLEESKKAYEKAQKEAAETAKLDFNKYKGEISDEHHVEINQPEEVLNFGPLKFHSGHVFANFGIGGKMVIIRPAGSIDPTNGQVFSTANIGVEDLRTFLAKDEQTMRVIELVQSFKGPLIPGQTPTHSVRLYIQRQIDALRNVEKSGDVKKSEIVDALLVWQLLEIMVQQHGRVTGPDVATLLTNASEELAEKTGVSESLENSANSNTSKLEAKEKFNKFLLGGHVNEAIESAISDGLYADAMTLIRRIYPNDTKKIEEIETRFLHLRSIDDPYATLVAVAQDQPPPILTNSAFDDDNNWKRHAAIILANLSSPTAMQTVYHLGLMLSKRERHCAADFCLLVVCILAGYDPFLPLGYADGEEKSRKHIGLIHSGSHILNKIDGLSGIAGFSFTDLHATDIFDFALRLSNPTSETPLAKSKEYQTNRLEYIKKIANYGGFATDAFRYCTEVARSIWPHLGAAIFETEYLEELAELAENLKYLSASPIGETEWIQSLRAMIGAGNLVGSAENVTGSEIQAENHSQAQAPENSHVQAQTQNLAGNIPQTEITPGNLAQLQNHAGNHIPSQNQNSQPQKPAEIPPLPKAQSNFQSEAENWHQDRQTPIDFAPAKFQQPDDFSSDSATLEEDSVTLTESTETSLVSAPPAPPKIAPIPPPAIVRPPIEIPAPKPPQPTLEAKSPRSELEDLWAQAPPAVAPKIAPRVAPSHQAPPQEQKQQKPEPRREKIGEEKSAPSLGNDRKSSSCRGWFGSIREKVIKSIPSNNAMILPDDSKPAITWDPISKKYIGAGVEEEVVAPPPPAMNMEIAPNLATNPTISTNSSTNSLRRGGASRYLKATGIATSSNSAAGAANLAAPDMMMAMMPPTAAPNFGFIPAVPSDESDEASNIDPFSAQTETTTNQANN